MKTISILLLLLIFSCSKESEDVKPVITCPLKQGDFDLIGTDKCGCLYGQRLYNQKYYYVTNRQPCI